MGRIFQTKSRRSVPSLEMRMARKHYPRAKFSSHSEKKKFRDPSQIQQKVTKGGPLGLWALRDPLRNICFFASLECLEQELIILSAFGKLGRHLTDLWNLINLLLKGQRAYFSNQKSDVRSEVGIANGTQTLP